MSYTPPYMYDIGWVINNPECNNTNIKNIARGWIGILDEDVNNYTHILEGPKGHIIDMKLDKTDKKAKYKKEKDE